MFRRFRIMKLGRLLIAPKAAPARDFYPIRYTPFTAPMKNCFFYFYPSFGQIILGSLRPILIHCLVRAKLWHGPWVEATLILAPASSPRRHIDVVSIRCTFVGSQHLDSNRKIGPPSEATFGYPTLRDKRARAQCRRQPLPVLPADRSLLNKILVIRRLLCAIACFRASSFRCAIVILHLGDGAVTAATARAVSAPSPEPRTYPQRSRSSVNPPKPCDEPRGRQTDVRYSKALPPAVGSVYGKPVPHVRDCP